MKIYTIGFTKKSAEEFFGILNRNKIERIIDVRLNNTSQLAGFTKRDDLAYFLRELCGIEYHHLKFLAPTKEIRDRYNVNRDWDAYKREYIKLIEKREILKKLDTSLFRKRTCLLCSEAMPDRCHRRLLAEYLKEHWGSVEVVHL
jgi:uncharacterized protein (DUF488 family)